MKRLLFTIITAVAVSFCAAGVDTTQVRLLVSKLTLEEKAASCSV